MAKAEQISAALEKLYGKRKDLDKQISDSEKKLLAEVKSAAKAATKKPAKKAAKKPAKKAAAKKPAARKVVAKKPVAPVSSLF
jgi:hypothetical protein